MDLETLARIRAINKTKQLMLEARRSQIRQGIADGQALAEKYKELDCGLGPAAEVGLSHVARTLGVIDRGIAALGQQHASVLTQLGVIDTVESRISELAAEAEIDLRRHHSDAELVELLERQVSPLKSGVSDTAEYRDDEI
ncbi:MAG: hypothetical protein CTY20_03660 [Hyphomicrobium sp.]|nr:MAG: hypothetical protein CTY20_03660 [Hyphomicrobium sp.]